MVDVSISLIGSNGDTIELSNSYSDFVLTTGVLGFGIPPTKVRIAESASAGGVWRNTKRGVRDIDLPVLVSGTGRQDVENKLRRLSNLLQDTNGPTRIRASYNDGTAYELAAHYVGGGDVEYGADKGATRAKWVLSLQAPNPYWQSVNPLNFTLQLSGGRGLIKSSSLSELTISGQYGFGDVTLTNPGDVIAYPTWVITGPCDSVSISQAGVGFTYDEAVGVGETVTIDTFTGTVVDQDGVNKYANLGPAPKLFPFQTGTQTVTIAALGADETTVIAGNFKPRREVLH
jgi:hypothetical protein